MDSINDRAAIVGIGQTEFSKDSGRSELQLAAEASRAAIADAGLQPSDIDGMITFTLDTSDELLLMRALGVPEIRYWSRTPHGGAGANTTVLQAAAAVASGAARNVLIWRAFNERSGNRFGQPHQQAIAPGWNWYLPFGLDTPAKIYSLTFQRYMDRYGLTNEDFGRYTVVARKHAATNPNAWFYQRPITLDDHQSLALDRGADPAAARLLPGERRRRRHRDHLGRTSPRPGAAGGAHRECRRQSPACTAT